MAPSTTLHFKQSSTSLLGPAIVLTWISLEVGLATNYTQLALTWEFERLYDNCRKLIKFLDTPEYKNVPCFSCSSASTPGQVPRSFHSGAVEEREKSDFNRCVLDRSKFMSKFFAYCKLKLNGTSTRTCHLVHASCKAVI